MGKHGPTDDRGMRHQAPTPAMSYRTPPPTPSQAGRAWWGTAGLFVGLAVGSLVGACGATQVAQSNGANMVMPSTTATVTVRKTVTATPRPKPKRTSAPSPTPSPSPAARSVVVTDGTWVVGEDIPPGTYKTLSAVSDRCYWEITKSGTNGTDIVTNDFPGGGRPVVTVKRGQDFHASNCGDWIRQD